MEDKDANPKTRIRVTTEVGSVLRVGLWIVAFAIGALLIFVVLCIVTPLGAPR